MYLRLVLILGVFLNGIVPAFARSITITAPIQLTDNNLPSNTRIIIKTQLNLNGERIIIPDGVTIDTRKGQLTNAIFSGKNTKIKYKRNSFSNVHFEGTWLVPLIKSSMMEDNNIEELFNLQNPDIDNTIVLEDVGQSYFVNINPSKARGAINLLSNTTLIINNTIELLPQVNPTIWNGYYIISIKNAENVAIKGTGKIVGDIYTGSLKDSEYGHGICIFGSTNISVSGIIIKNTQGDGIAISQNCGKCLINNICVDNFKRNGISVVDCSECICENIRLLNGGATSPFSGIDIEPNKGNNVGKVIISNAIIDNCKVGISNYACPGSSIGLVHYDNISLSNIHREAINASCLSNILFENITITGVENVDYIMRILNCNSVEFKGVKVFGENCKAKYPFYLNNTVQTFNDCFINTPQIFTFHLSNATFNKCHFIFNSFVWTAANRSTKNVCFDTCTFDGPLFMRPSMTTFINSTFRLNDHTLPVVSFEDASNSSENDWGLVFENNIIEHSSNCLNPFHVAIKNNSISNNSIITK